MFFDAEKSDVEPRKRQVTDPITKKLVPTWTPPTIYRYFGPVSESELRGAFTAARDRFAMKSSPASRFEAACGGRPWELSAPVDGQVFPMECGHVNPT